MVWKNTLPSVPTENPIDLRSLAEAVPVAMTRAAPASSIRLSIVFPFLFRPDPRVPRRRAGEPPEPRPIDVGVAAGEFRPAGGARHAIHALAFPVHRLQRRQRAPLRDPRPVAPEA